MRGWLETRGRALLGLLSDIGGALTFVVVAVGLIVAALAGAVLVALDVFPEPFLALLVVGMAFLGVGLALHFLRRPLTPPPPAPVAPAGQPPYSQAAALQGQHDRDEAEKEGHDRQLRERKALRRVREELLDNEHVLGRASNDRGQLLSLKFDAWNDEESALLEQDDPTPHGSASAAYREIEGLRQSRVAISERTGKPYVINEPLYPRHLEPARTAIRKAVETLEPAATSASK